MGTQDQDFLEKIKEGIVDELYSAKAFHRLSEFLNEDEESDFLVYAQEELDHAQELILMYQEKSGEEPELDIPEVPKITHPLIFFVDYLSKEESSIFFYEGLIRFVEDKAEKEMFTKIKKEEENHYESIRQLIEKYKGEHRHE